MSTSLRTSQQSGPSSLSGWRTLHVITRSVGLRTIELRFDQLLAMEVGVVAGLREQLRMRPFLRDAAVLEHDDGVGVADRGRAVRDQNRRPAAHHGAQAAENPLFRLRVD